MAGSTVVTAFCRAGASSGPRRLRQAARMRWAARPHTRRPRARAPKVAPRSPPCRTARLSRPRPDTPAAPRAGWRAPPPPVPAPHAVAQRAGRNAVLGADVRDRPVGVLVVVADLRPGFGREGWCMVGAFEVGVRVSAGRALHLVPSPLVGEGNAELQRKRMGEGASPHPIICAEMLMRPSPTRGEGATTAAAVAGGDVRCRLNCGRMRES